MKIGADDWHFRSVQNDMLVIDLFLSNAQHALLEVFPMKNTAVSNGQIPEMVVFSEFPGEKLSEGNSVARWITRPPERACLWSNVQVPPALMQQIRQKLGYAEAFPAVVAAA
jgi:hypothetical protein